MNAGTFNINALLLAIGSADNGTGNGMGVLNRDPLESVVDVSTLVVSNGSTFEFSPHDQAHNKVVVVGGSQLTFHENSITRDLQLFNGAQVETASENTVDPNFGTVEIIGAGSKLTLNANLTGLSNVVISGEAAIPASIKPRAWDINTQNLTIGEANNLAKIENRTGGKVAASTLVVTSPNEFEFLPDDQASFKIVAFGPDAIVSLHPNTSTKNLELYNGAEIELIAPGNLSFQPSVLVFGPGSELTINTILTESVVECEVRGGTEAEPAELDLRGNNFSVGRLTLGDGKGQVSLGDPSGRVIINTELRVLDGNSFVMDSSDDYTRIALVDGIGSTLFVNAGQVDIPIARNGGCIIFGENRWRKWASRGTDNIWSRHEVRAKCLIWRY